MKVGYLTPSWPPGNPPNGIATYVDSLLEGGALPFDASVFAINVADGEVPSRVVVDLKKYISEASLLRRIGYRYKPLSYRIKHDLENALSNAILMNGKDLSILELEESRGVLFGLEDQLEIPIVRRLHGPWAIIRKFMDGKLTRDDRYRIRIEGHAIAAAGGITAPSKAVLDDVRETYKLDLIDARVIPNPVAQVNRTSQWVEPYDSEPRILYVGRFDRLKGADLLLKAFRIVAAKYNDVCLDFVGKDGGVVENGKKMLFDEYLSNIFPESRIRNRVRYYGILPPKQIVELRRAATVTVVSSRYEVFSYALTEAMSYGCPTVATGVGGIPEILMNGRNGLIAEAESAESIAQNIISFLDDPILRSQVSRNAVEKCLLSFKRDVVVRKNYEYYQRVSK